MRAATFSIIVYILFLLSQPCQDVFAAPSYYEEYTAIATVQAPSNDEEASDICSPFCICSCCGLAVGYHSAFIITEPERTVTGLRKNDIEYNAPAMKNFSDSIWQPPKL